MRDSLNAELERWTRAGLIDEDQASRIRAFEAARTTGISWPVRLALLFGAVMLAAGVLLFVSAHWDSLSPAVRFGLVLATLAALHLGAAAASPFPALRSALHAVGTIALGGAIFVTGQIFNLEERWSAGILMWAFGAGVAWVVLDDAPQLALTAILTPAWLANEWMIVAQRDPVWRGRVIAVGLFLVALSYLAADERVVRRDRAAVLRWLGAIALIPAGLGLWYAASEPIDWRPRAGVPREALSLEWLALGWSVAWIAPLLVAYAVRRRGAWLHAGAAVWALVAVNLWRVDGTLALYGWFTVAAVALAAWGVREARPALINLGTAGFAIVVVGFYFSEVMDKLGRSASLIGFGLMFLAGGWILERTRRRLVEQATTGGA